MSLIIVFIFGLVVGSFLNVCIVRLPKGRSIVNPPSHCPKCQERIKWYDNIPVLSFFILRGRCRSCGQKISWRYPIVELMNGMFYIWIYSEFGLGGEMILVMALCSALIVITFIDLDYQIIPDVITLPGMLAGLILGPFFMTALSDPLPFGLAGVFPHAGPYVTGLLNSFIGLMMGGAPLFIIGWLWERLRNIEAMGGGDVKLMAMVGSLIGWKGALLTIMLGALTGSLAGMILIIFKRHSMNKVIPFGPFLALGAVITTFYGHEIVYWYLGLLRI